MTDSKTASGENIVIQTQELAALLNQTSVSSDVLLPVFVGSHERFCAAHIPKSAHITPSELVCGVSPAMGKIADEEDLSALFSRIGLNHEKTVIAYDDEGGGWAGRLIWTLDVINHNNYRFLDGGINAWLADTLPVETGDNHRATPSIYSAKVDRSQIASRSFIEEQLNNTNFKIWDARSPSEYSGEKVLAARGGRIPGARNLDWLELMDKANALRLRPRQDILAMLDQIGINAQQSIVTHCQSHHRSGLTYLVGKILEFDIKAYDGSWSEWGNLADTPIESDFN